MHYVFDTSENIVDDDHKIVRIADGLSRYENVRFGTILDVPTGLFRSVEILSKNNSGCVFQTQDGAQLRVLGSHISTTVYKNFAEYKIWSLRYMQREGIKISYKDQGEDWLVASGSEGSDLIYVKMIQGCEAIHQIEVIYPSKHENIYLPLMSRLSGSLRCCSPKHRKP